MAENDADLWTFDVESVSRISHDPGEEDDGLTYAVMFNANGPNASGEIEVFVDGVPDPTLIITRAMNLLHRALAEWTAITLGRRIANDEGGPGQG